VHNLNKALARIGVDVTVYTTNAGLEAEVAPDKQVRLNGISVTYFSAVKLFDMFGETGWQFSPRMSRALKENLRAFDMVYMIGVWNYPFLAAARYCLRYHKPYIVSPRGLLYPYGVGRKRWKKFLYYHLIIKEMLKRARGIHYTTEDELEACHASLGLKGGGFVVPNGIEPAEFDDLPRSEEFKNRYPVLRGKKIMLFLGRIDRKKGLELLIGAYRRIAGERDDVHLVIVGDDNGPYAKRLKGWIARDGLTERATFTGILTGRDKLASYTASDVFILPSYSENFGMAAVEAMACGVAVVLSEAVGISREVRRNDAAVVVKCQEDSVYRGIKAILDNDGLRGKLSSIGRRMAKEYYNIDAIAKRMVEFFHA
jgi:glycosyltransferase involved in cell wall biosynthesis